jgi:carboxyl-terminal processing protease
MNSRLRSRALFVATVLSSALISGGWFVRRGLVGAMTSSSVMQSDRRRLYEEVFQHVSRDFVDTLPDSTIYQHTVDGLLGELHDPHSAYLTPQRLARLSESTSGRYAGVGLQIDVRDGWITVINPMPGGPALDAGILTGDRVVELDGKSTQDWTPEEAQKALRGMPGSEVKLTVERPGVGGRLPFTIKRREIRVRSVPHALMLGPGVGYIDLTVFSEQSANDLRHAVDSLRSAGMRSLILDLRSDPGGLLDQGVAVSDLFLDPGKRIVSMRGRTPDANRDYNDREPQPWPNLPIALLVDSGSASAAEIVAGALQDHDRAVLVGTATYGKGSAQSLFGMPSGGALKLTTALWYTPSGRSINKRHDTPSDDDERPTEAAPAKAPRFKTDAGRTVLGGGGITPDVVVPGESIPETDVAFEHALGKNILKFRDALTDYALSLKASGAVKSTSFIVTPEMRAALLTRMQARGIQMDRATYERATPLIDRMLETEIARYVFGETVRFERRLHGDSTVAAAVRIVSGAMRPQDVLDRAKR